MITWSQSALKDIGCPRRWYDVWIDGNKLPPTPPMEKGLFFETLCLGASAHGDGTESLPLVRGGKKSADQIRIEQQAARFKRMVDPISSEFVGWEVDERQLVLEHNNIRGVVDFTSKPDVVWDLKLTASLDGYWAGEVDLTQQITYKWLYEQIRGVSPEMYLMIFEYETRMRVKIVEVKISEAATQGVLDRFSKADLDIKEYSMLSEFPRVPSRDQCSKCSLPCQVRNARPGIIYETYEI